MGDKHLSLYPRTSATDSPSSRPAKSDPHGITCVVPMVTHVDHTEHDLDIVGTEQGMADMRGLCPRERASREFLAKNMGHQPHLLFSA